MRTLQISIEILVSFLSLISCIFASDFYFNTSAQQISATDGSILNPYANVNVFLHRLEIKTNNRTNIFLLSDIILCEIFSFKGKNISFM